MPTLPLDDTELYYTQVGQGDATIVFAHGLLFDHRQYDAQLDVLSDEYRCIAYDHRGQGESARARPPIVDMETLYLDAVRLVEQFDAAPCHFVGLSMGGFVGLRLAARRPDLVESLVLADTRAGRESSEHIPRYERLTFVARWIGVEHVVDRVLPLMFGETFLNDPDRAGVRATWRNRLAALPKSIYRAVNGVLYRPGVEPELDEIDVPVLVLHGEEDRAIPIEVGRALADRIDGASFEGIPNAGHLVSIERPELVTERIANFLEGL